MIRKKKHIHSYLGTVLTELSLAIPLVFVLLFGLVDLSGWLTEHSQLSSVAYEGVRYASSVTGLSESSAESESRLNLIQLRVRELVTMYNPNIANPDIQVAYTGPENDNLVSVSIEVPYTPQFVAWAGDLSVSVFAQAPYLYPGDAIDDNDLSLN